MSKAIAVPDLRLDRPLPADENPAAIYLASLAKGSVPTQRSALVKIASLFGLMIYQMDWARLRYQHIQFIRARLAEDYSSATANRMLTALRRVLEHAWRLRQIDEQDYSRLKEIEPVRGSKDDVEDELMGRALTAGELAALMSVCMKDESIAGVRDAAIIALGYGLGMRRAEVARLQLADYDRGKTTVKVRGGKGNKSRVLPIEDGPADALDDWIIIRGGEPGNMFYGINKGGNVSTRKLNLRAINELYAKRATEAGVTNSQFHDLRRTFGSDLFDQHVDVATIAKLYGHSDPRTTLKYDRRRMETRRKAVKTLHVPYQRRKRG